MQLLKNTDTLNRASASLHRAQKISAQTDRMGANIIDELGEQRSSLVRTRNKVFVLLRLCLCIEGEFCFSWCI